MFAIIIVVLIFIIIPGFYLFIGNWLDNQELERKMKQKRFNEVWKEKETE